ncbi:FAD-dependent oxidoreductase [Herbiconiux sp. CPCC 205763]|uniref:FAD-dependent oxidoreductase n=1 Tax=Herbiconiux aconitum TaxID=2970913 RepID=A0ABT2GSN9_9MICO|nr:FAD-dependent oxidoreductase [Herbiconiux aconitum]MCS5719225.1 FAD-dependent oxidoreductase [Herbiconiux aconitum]
MTDAPQSFVIVGAALAGASAAKTLREEGFDGRIVLVGLEEHHPYIRPPLSKEFLSGAAERDSVFVEKPEWYGEHEVELRRGVRALSVDPIDRLVALDDGRELHYEKLLLATGSHPRRPPLEGLDLQGVHLLRTLDDAEVLRAELAGGGRSVVSVGAGWIGLEVAATARTLGNDVTVLMRGAMPLASVLGDEVGRVFARLHSDNGVELLGHVSVARLLGTGGTVIGVELADGTVLSADLVVVGIGAAPNLELAESAGLELTTGVAVDEHLRSSDPHIWAAGDIADAWHPLVGLRLRTEHWANALNGGAAAARSMLEQDSVYDDIPYFYTDQFDLGMEYSGFGLLARGAEVVFRGDTDAREFIAFWLADGKVVAGMNVNVWNVNEAVQDLIRRGTVVDRAALADPGVPLADL